MKSRTLSCETTILRKDLTRFAPMWISLAVVLATCAFEQLTSMYPDPYEFLPIGFIFAPIFALNLFGYLMDPAECSAAHCLPIRRECLFLLHTIAAFAMYLVPMGIYFIATDPMMEIGILPRLGWSILEFAFSFALSLLCMFITGRKVGAALLYLFFEMLPILTGLFIEYLYLPLLPGISLDNHLLYPGLTSGFIGSFITDVFHGRVQDHVWLFAAIVLMAAAALYVLCLVMYRRRQLEHAGDLLAVRWLDPVFAVCSGLTGGCVIDLFLGIGGSDLDPLLFALGLAAGYFSYWMLSKKSVRVFKPKALAGFAALIALLAGSMLVVSMDPLDRVHHQPDISMIRTAALYEGYADAYRTSDPAQIAALQALQLELLEDHCSEPEGNADYHLYMNYTLRNGQTLQRHYLVGDKAVLDQVEWYLSQPVALFGTDEPEVRYLDVHRDGEIVTMPQELTAQFMEIFLEDCRQGRMFRFGWNSTSPDWDLEFHLADGLGAYVNVEAAASDTIAWLTEHCTPEN